MSVLAAPALIFFANAFLYISMFLRLPDLVEQVGIEKALLGLSLIGGAVGTFCALPFASRIVQDLTPRIAAALLLTALALIQILVFSTSTYWLFFACLVCFGACRTILEVAQNVVATQIEAETGRHVMARSHGFWSVGLLSGSLFSGLVTGLGAAMWLHMVMAAIIVFMLVGLMLVVAPRTVTVSLPSRRRFFAMPDRAILVVCAMMFGVAITEGAIYDWAAFYIKQVLLADPAMVGILFSCFTLGMGSTRMVGDALRMRFSAPQIVRCSVLATALGILVLLASADVYTAAAGLMLVGAGVALNAPLAMGTAARLGGGSPSDNLAAMSMVNTLAFLGVPAGLGFVAEHLGLKVAFALLLLPLIASFALAPITGVRGRNPEN